MASEVLKITAQIVMSHASVTELTPKELVAEIKQIYNVLASLEGEGIAPETMARVARYPKARSITIGVSPEAKAIPDEDWPVFGDPDYMEFMASREG